MTTPPGDKQKDNASDYEDGSLGHGFTLILTCTTAVWLRITGLLLRGSIPSEEGIAGARLEGRRRFARQKLWQGVAAAMNGVIW